LESANNEQEKLLSQLDLKKMALTNCLKRYIDAIEVQAQHQIVERTPFDRLFSAMPEQVRLDSPAPLPPQMPM